MADTLSLDIPVRGSADVAETPDPKATRMSDFAGDLEVNADQPLDVGDDDTPEAEDTEGLEDTTEASEQDAEEGSTPDEDDLPEYDPDDEEVKAAYDAKFFTGDGTLDRDALSATFWKAFDAAPEDKRSEVRLPAGVKKFLSDVTGFDEAAIDDITAAVRDQTVTQQRDFKKRFGGDALVDAALRWGGEHYSEAQRRRFAEAQAKGFNSDEAAEQLEILISRAGRAGALKGIRREGADADTIQPSSRPRRPSSPKRNVTSAAQSQPSADVFKSVDEYNTAWAEALRSQDQGKIAYVRRKLKRSPAAQVSN
jgi:hypothetical protein